MSTQPTQRPQDAKDLRTYVESILVLLNELREDIRKGMAILEEDKPKKTGEKQ